MVALAVVYGDEVVMDAVLAGLLVHGGNLGACGLRPIPRRLLLLRSPSSALPAALNTATMTMITAKIAKNFILLDFFSVLIDKTLENDMSSLQLASSFYIISICNMILISET